MIYCTGPALVFPENFFAGAGRGAGRASNVVEARTRLFRVYGFSRVISLSRDTRVTAHSAGGVHKLIHCYHTHYQDLPYKRQHCFSRGRVAFDLFLIPLVMGLGPRRQVAEGEIGKCVGCYVSGSQRVPAPLDELAEVIGSGNVLERATCMCQDGAVLAGVMRASCPPFPGTISRASRHVVGGVPRGLAQPAQHRVCV